MAKGLLDVIVNIADAILSSKSESYSNAKGKLVKDYETKKGQYEAKVSEKLSSASTEQIKKIHDSASNPLAKNTLNNELKKRGENDSKPSSSKESYSNVTEKTVQDYEAKKEEFETKISEKISSASTDKLKKMRDSVDNPMVINVIDDELKKREADDSQ